MRDCSCSCFYFVSVGKMDKKFFLFVQEASKYIHNQYGRCVVCVAVTDNFEQIRLELSDKVFDH